jgi:hypothetical protein
MDRTSGGIGDKAAAGKQIPVLDPDVQAAGGDVAVVAAGTTVKGADFTVCEDR